MGENASFQCKNVENNLFYSNILLPTQGNQYQKLEANTESNHQPEPDIFPEFAYWETYTSLTDKT